ncbi:hypothetical protein LPJ61_001987 [Coemansia biformis]|uniref:Glutathione S-transferase n=1 Tax=Coemansia biformis TaxID=1286918 RepID=A0A9W7YFD6_9FUNG|nr:hypothetical protein LPJ61_001987 [Coemansia biformis]
MAASNTPSYVLRYFDLAGRAETTRLLLTAANVEWTEEHPEWPAEKNNQPFGVLPVLVEKSTDGSPDFVIGQSGTIERYVAHRYGFLPTDLKEAALQEQFRDQTLDVGIAFYRFALSNEGKEDKKKVFVDTMEKFVRTLTDLLVKNGNNGHVFGDELSYADAVSYGYHKHLLAEVTKLHADATEMIKSRLTPEIIKHLMAIEADPILAAHMSKTFSVTEIVQA